MNIWREILKELPPAKRIEIIAESEKDQEIAAQFTLILDEFLKDEKDK